MRISDWSSDVCSSDLVAVIGATVYDLEMKPIGAEWLKPEVQPPMDRLKPLAAREGGARRNVVQFGWSSPAGPVQTVVAAVGGFRPAGYIALHVDPLPQLKGLEKRLGMNVADRPPGGSQTAPIGSAVCGGRVGKEVYSPVVRGVEKKKKIGHI